MKVQTFAVRTVMPLVMLAWTLSAQAQAPAAPTTCKDGTTSTSTGRGACSNHGGVQKAAAAPAAPAAPAATPAPAPAPAATPPPATTKAPATTTTPAPKSTSSSSTSTKAPTTAAGNTDPTGATAKCKDGTYSKSQHHSGTCSSHGGVDTWLTPSK
jgi:hypothetical protein